MYIIRAMPHVATVGITNKIAVIFFIGFLELQLKNRMINIEDQFNQLKKDIKENKNNIKENRKNILKNCENISHLTHDTLN